MIPVKALVFFDLDGTLLNDQSQLTDEVIEALHRMPDNGVIPFIATGRTNTEIQEILEKTGIDSFITMNGQYASFKGKEILNHKIPNRYVKELEEKAKELQHQVAFYKHSGIILSENSDMANHHYEHLSQPVPPISTPTYTEDSYNMLLILGQGYDDVYQEAFPDLTFYRNTPYSIDVVSEGHCKGTGVEEILRHLNDNVTTFAFGDGPNDLELLRACDYKIAMGNAVEDLKRQADYITGDHNEHGIIEALNYYNLI
ncbi:Cof-type HAD-IIB family hydrolase [Vagococcus xieshaowenii]|uniref:Cof-type HAD-IIB family hydrolase n=1 Tax=Vagococcus xieshaowenii TaxID=2562451 RepID=A0AAJ5EEM9_9ENTE|nr:Cof-type HAD-IIB family hydrolase [Vagococcus xieshaowenii]QCA28082.1 Cof-type HAD-IIB family hydrolase [Vagococcus xieshaowenii]TFZ40125.1 Cof-type HAD-IIB family hydrolase [Vagococcus xieshaowenii]